MSKKLINKLLCNHIVKQDLTIEDLREEIRYVSAERSQLAGDLYAARREVKASRTVLTAPTIAVEELENLMDPAWVSTHKISAIKAARRITGYGLKEAKELVEKMNGHNSQHVKPIVEYSSSGDVLSAALAASNTGFISGDAY